MPNHLDRIFKLFQEVLVKLKVELENGVRLAWPTPIFNKKYENTEELNRSLVEIIHEKEKIDVGNFSTFTYALEINRDRALSRSCTKNKRKKKCLYIKHN